ncbi:MAG: hypothetical protein EA390_13535 [Balneolaceae bacterium]|nr:MAG: hypothetical protein EA390_13535 [Balneolaceae bacterium]
MKKCINTIFVIVLFFLANGCDAGQGAFEDTIPNLHTLSTAVTPEGSGAVSPSGGDYVSENTVQVSAIASEGYIFDRWEGDLSGNSNPEFLYFNNNKSVTAVFVRVVTKINPANSVITVSPAKLKVGEYSTVTIDLRDDGNNPFTGLSEADFVVDITGSATVGTLHETTVSGTYQFEITNNTPEETSLSVTADGITLTEKPSLIFEVGDPSQLVILTQPESTQSGSPIGGPPSVSVMDKFGHRIPYIEVSVKEQGGQALSGGDTVVATNQAGIAEFENLVIHGRNEWFTLTFSVSGLDEVATDRFRITAGARGDDDHDD